MTETESSFSTGPGCHVAVGDEVIVEGVYTPFPLYVNRVDYDKHLLIIHGGSIEFETSWANVVLSGCLPCL